ncbi:MAG: hypothetical protein M3271_10035, partial [Actinomycetota bacterium]|nr:hypothetical protein [Actinomycetota bacterium]
MNERSFVVFIGAGLAAAVVGASILFFANRGDESDGPQGDGASPQNAAAALAGGPDEVLLLNGRSLVRREVGANEDEVIRNLPPAGVYAAPGSTWVAYVNSKPVEDFATEPELTLYDTETEDKVRIGAGVAPVWNATGTRVAFLRPVEPRSCLGEECSGDVEVVVMEPETERDADLLEPGRYSILGWAGEFLLVSDFADPTNIVSVSLEGERQDLDFPVSQFWAASPDGRWLVKTNAKKTEFVAFDEGGLAEERIPIALDDYELLEGAWSHDSSRIAAVVSVASGGKGTKGKKTSTLTTQAVTLSP